MKINRQVERIVHEHILVFVDGDRSRQIWQWVRRKPGQPHSVRHMIYDRGQPGDSIAQRLAMLAFDLSEAEALTVVDVAGRTRAAFDVDRVTKRFYDQFRKEHAALLDAISGISDSEDRDWYGSLLLNRLMFVYFVQKKGVLDGDRDYLRSRLRQLQERVSEGGFYTFYRHFLLRLFYEGLAEENRDNELDVLLGDVPYLNGGLFDQHILETRYPDIDIPDAWFDQVFDFFDSYHWHLDARPLAADQRDQSRRARLHLREVRESEADGCLLHEGGRHRLHRPEFAPHLDS